jgi:site-specific DNA recombinase
MKTEWMGDSAEGSTIIRVSSKRQEGNISHETQEKEIRAYCLRHGIKLREQNIIRIVESAKDSDARKKYGLAIKTALARDVRHILFYMYDREARNLTDNEKNEKLVKAGIICLHYVRDNKVLHKDSPDSEFFIRDVQAAANKQFSRNLSVKVIDAMRQKAEQGWYPSNHVPMGYALQKMRDENGKELKRGATVVRDPDERAVRQARLEFELRAKGYSFNEIRTRVIEAKLVPIEQAKHYFIASIEHRVKNPFYAGRFRWQGREYEGKHELIIPPAHFLACQRSGRGMVTKRGYDGLHGLFGGGWLHCGECGCQVTYDPKKKVAKGTKKVTIFHYYRCTNGRRMHESQRGMNISEEKVWEMLDTAVDSIDLSPALARDISDAMNDSHKKKVASGARKIADLKDAMKLLEKKEDRAYEEMGEGVLDAEGYRRQVARVREERKQLAADIQALQAQMSGAYRETALTTIELCKEAKSLYLSQNHAERAEFLKRVVSNPLLSNGSIGFEMKKPFAVLAQMASSDKWRARLESNQRPSASEADALSN